MGGPLDNLTNGDGSLQNSPPSPFLAQLEAEKARLNQGRNQGQDMERVNGSTPWRATYGQDVQNNYVQGQDPSQQQQQSNRPWRATYGQDVQNNFRQGQDQTQQQPWRGTYGQDVGNNFRPGDPSQSSTPWRQTYGGDVGNNYRPGDQQGTGTGTGNTPWRPPYGGDVGRTYNPGQQNDPNRNGDQSGGPVWRPKPQPGWNSPGPAPDGSQQGQVGQTTRPGQQQGDPYANIRPLIDQSLDKHVGFGGNMVIGGLSGSLAAGPIPWIFNRTADTLLLDPEAQPGARRVLFPDGSWGKKYMPNGLREGIEGMPDRYDKFLRENVAAPEGSMRQKAAQYWRDNFDERQRFAKDLIKQQSVYNQHNAAIDDLITKNETATEALLKKGGAELSATEAKELSRLTMRGDWLKSDSWLSAKEGATQLEKVTNATRDFAVKNSGAELFSKSELGMLEARQTALQSQSKLAMAAEEGAPFWGKAGFLSNFVKGASFVGATMIADHYLDRAFFGKSHHQGLNDNSANEVVAAPLGSIPFVGKPLADSITKPGSLNTNALLLPLAFATTKPWSKEGLLLTAGALVGGKLIDKGFQLVFPEKEGKQFSDVFRPTGVDALTMGAAFMLPTNDVKTKAMLVGGSWAFGRMTNMDTKWSLATAGGIAATIGLSGLDARTKVLAIGADFAAWGLSRVLHSGEGPDKRAINDDAWDLLKKDSSKRSDSSMNSAIDKFYELGQAGKDRQLRFYYEDWLRPDRKFDDYLSAYRGAVIIGTSFGESRLQNGTLKGGTDQPEFLLQGKDLDIGSQALRGFIVARVNAERAKQQTQNLVGKQDQGTEVKQSEIDDLNNVEKRIDAGMAKIYGKHDIAGAMRELEYYYSQDTQGFGKMLISVDGNIAKNLNTNNSQFLAKQFRDAALISMTAAEFKLNNGHDGGGAADAFNGSTNQVAGGPAKHYSVWQAIQQAQRLDPNNPDLQQLADKARELQGKIPGAQQEQMSNSTFNPLNVDNGLYNGTKR